AFAQTFFGKSLTKNFFGTPLKAGASPPHPLEFRRLRTATRALPLDPTSFLKKAGQKLLISPFA
ncbi:MAG: hypothetical protein ACI4JM_13255, partial [Oscillospiraceae bacterium]